MEIGEGLIRAVVAEALKGKRRITGLISESVSVQGPDAAAEAVKKIFLSLGFIPRKVSLNIPRHLVTARFLKIPSVDDREIEKIIRIESIKHLPYTDEKVIYGYRVIEKLEDGYSNVLLVIAQASVVNNFLDILKKALVGGVRSFCLSSEALYYWYTMAGEAEDKGNVMLVNLDPGRIDIDVVEGDKLVFTRGAAYSANGTEKIEEITRQIKISISAYQKESALDVSRVILTGAKRETAGCYPALSEGLKLPVDIIDQAKNIPIDENIKPPIDEASFAELLGLALRSDGIKINLLPEPAMEDARIVQAKNALITALLLTALLVTMISGVLIKKMRDKYVYLASISAELKKMEPNIAVAKKMAKDVSVTRQIMGRKPLAVDVFTEACGITPAGMSLSTLDFESGRSLTVRGTAPALGDVLRYVTILENSPYFEGVKVKYANKRMSENKEITDFEINVLLTALK
ncbi:MAG: pilus assembly protein PilM [Candidatus Omnitrophica bacterium]|nr:pilus assembly protein PilM [Candidatus Omnitrophota bacterium]